MSLIKINAQEYAWGDILIYMWAQPVLRARAIEYKRSQKQEYLYGAGRQPIAVQCGEFEFPGTLTVLQSELEAFNRTARSKGYKSIVGMSGDIVVQYMKDGIVTEDKICAATFGEYNKGQKQGDLQSEHAIPFKALDLKDGLV